MKTFASIYIGTYEIVLKVFEMTKSRGLKEIDCLRGWCDISRDILHTGEVSFPTLDALVDTLRDMKVTIKTYKCDAYKIYAGYTLEQAKNAPFVLDQIQLKLNLKVEVLSNSEQRFITYLALTALPNFEDIVSESALLVDIGGSSIQMTLFEDGEIVTTEHVLLGAARIRESLLKLKDKKDANSQVSEMIKKELATFSNIYLQGLKPKYLILVNNQIHNVTNRLPIASRDGIISLEDYSRAINKVKKKKLYAVLSETFEYDTEDEMLMPFILLYQSIIEQITADNIMIPGISVSEGIAYDYAYRTGFLKAAHNFDEDVLSASWAIAERFGSYLPHLRALEAYATQIFDQIKKTQKLSPRERLLLRVCCILHDCGKYISISLASQCTDTIIMSSEILGLSHKERFIVAKVCASHRMAEPYPYEKLATEIDKEDYMRYLKLLAILRISNALDHSHKQKFKKTQMAYKEEQLVITLNTDESISLEKGLFLDKARFFEGIFHIKPVIREKRK